MPLQAAQPCPRSSWAAAEPGQPAASVPAAALPASAAVSTVVGLSAAWTGQHPACAAPVISLPATCLCCPQPACLARATLLPVLPRCLPCPSCPHPAHAALLPMPCLWHCLPWQCCSSASPEAHPEPPTAIRCPTRPSSAQPLSSQPPPTPPESALPKRLPPLLISTHTESGLYTFPCTASRLTPMGTTHLAIRPGGPHLCTPTAPLQETEWKDSKAV